MAETSVGQIGLDLVINQNQFDKQFSGIKGMAAKAGAAIATAFAVEKLVAFGKSCIELGSDLTEVQNVVDVTFTSMSSQVDKFAKNAAADFGLSETMAKRYTGTFGAMAKAFGFNEKAAYDMSTTLTGLAGDVASFYNISQDEAYTKLKSVFTGETETLKDLGVVMTQNALDAYAMANGYGKTTSAMSEAEKVALRYAFVQDQLSAAAGDFSRTSGTWANQVRMLNLQFESLKATIGQGLINVFTPVIQVINTLIGRLFTLAEAFKNLTGSFGNFSISNSKTEKTTKKIAENTKKLADTLGDTGAAATTLGSTTSKAATKAGKSAEKAAKKMRSLMGFDQINKVSEKESSSSGSSGSGGTGGVGGAGISMGSMSAGDTSIDTGDTEEKLKPLPKLYENLAKSIKGFKNACSELGKVLAAGLKWGYENVLKPLGKWTISEFLPKVIDVFSGAIRVLTSVIKALAPLGKWLWDNFLSKLAKFAGDVIVKFLELLATGLNKLSDWIDKHQESVQTIAIILGSFFAAFKAVSLVSSAVGIITKIAGAFSSFKKVISFLGGPLSAIAKVFKNLPMIISLIASPIGIATVVIGALVAGCILIYKNWNKIKKTAFGKFLTNIAKTFKTLYKNIKDNLHPIQDLKKAWEAIKDKKAQLEAEVKEKVEGAVEKIREGWEAVKDKAASLVAEAKEKVSGAIESLKDKWETVKDKAATLVAEAKEKAGGVIETLKEKWESIKDKAASLVAEAKEKTSGAIDTLKEGWESFKDKTVSLTAKIATTFKELVAGFVNKAIDFQAKLTSWGDSLKNKVIAFGAKMNTWSDSLKSKVIAFGAKINSWSDSLKNKLISFTAQVTSVSNKIKSKVLSFMAKINGFINAIKKSKAYLSFSAKITGFINAIKSKVLPFVARITGTTKADGGIYKNGRWSPIQKFASGGLPNQGQMFIAREAGPELVGTLGGHTAVVNNDQIVASVSSGVAKAVSSSMIKIGQSLYNAIASLKINLNMPSNNIVPPLKYVQSANTKDLQQNNEIISLLRQLAAGGGNTEIISLLKQIIALLNYLDRPIYLDGKAIKDNTVKRINNNTIASGKCEIIM